MVEQRLRQVSSAVFGNRYRLELLSALVTAGQEGICVTDLATSRGVPTSVFYPPLRSLTAARLVQRLPGTRQDRRVFYAITQAPAWTGLRQLVHDLEASDPGPGDHRGGER